MWHKWFIPAWQDFMELILSKDYDLVPLELETLLSTEFVIVELIQLQSDRSTTFG
jgi:hypothetical protein